jgi:hypothetical protein
MNPHFVVWAMTRGPLKKHKSKIVSIDLIVLLHSGAKNGLFRIFSKNVSRLPVG